MSEIRLAPQSPLSWASPLPFSPLPGEKTQPLGKLTPGYASPAQVFSCPAPGSNPGGSLSLSNLQSQTAELVAGKAPAEEPYAEAVGNTGLAAGTVSDASGAAAKVAGQAGNLGRLGRVARVAGPVGGVLANGAQLVETGMEIREARRDPSLTEAEKEQKAGKAAVVGGAKVLGGMGGMAGGMALGFAVGGPVGLVVGAVAGGFGGDWVGGKLGEALGDTGVGRAVGKLLA
jgi:hypothetical protein